jgi:cell wall-associated NlpC family hydrolase
MAERARVVESARAWLGTPYRALARVRGSGVDCGQLLLAVYAEAGIIPDVDPGIYSPQWHLHRSEELYLGWVERWCVPTDAPALGDVALFRYGRTISHGGIIVGTDPQMTVVHAYVGEGVRLEELAPNYRLFDRLVGYWTLRSWDEAGRDAA